MFDASKHNQISESFYIAKAIQECFQGRVEKVTQRNSLLLQNTILLRHQQHLGETWLVKQKQHLHSQPWNISCTQHVTCSLRISRDVKLEPLSIPYITHNKETNKSMQLRDKNKKKTLRSYVISDSE